MWTRGAAVCSLVVALPACSDESAFSRIPLLSPTASPEGTSPTLGHPAAAPSTTVNTDAGRRRTTAPPLPMESGAPPPGGDAAGMPDAAPRPAGLVDRGFEAFSWASLPVLATSAYAKTSSYDRDEASAFPFVRPGNKDFNTWLAVCGAKPAIGYATVVGGASCTDGVDGYLVAALDDGPGYVSRIFFTHDDFDPNAKKDAETIHVYVDDLDTPAYEGKLADWGMDGNDPFVAPLAGWTSGAMVSYVPISYAKKVRVLLDDLSTSGVYYYQVETHSSAPTAPFDQATLASVPETAARLEREVMEGSGRKIFTDDVFTLAAGGTAHLLDQEGPGSIEFLRISVEDAANALSGLELHVAWDDVPTLAISLPLDALFGQRPRLAAFETLAMGVELRGTSADLRLSFPMPFSTHARIELLNNGRSACAVQARIEGTPRLAAGAGRLHAALGDRRAPMGQNDRFPVAELTGKGRYVGSVLFLEGKGDTTLPVSSPLNFLEGDDALVVDGQAVGHGTGTEDFFDGGWYFEDGPFGRPFTALVSISDPSQARGQVSAVRWQSPTDTVDYQSSLTLTLEYGAHQPSTAIHYSSVAFSYQSR